MLIYKIESLIDGRMYIGQTIRPLQKRIAQYKADSKSNKSNQYIHRAMKKYGFENFKFIVIDYATTQEQLDKKEIAWIYTYSSNIKGIGFNLESGGKGKGKVSEESKQKMSNTMKGHLVSEETRKKLSDFNKGNIPSEETRKKLSETSTGRKHSEDTKKKMSEYSKNRSDEHKNKLSKNRKGKTWKMIDGKQVWMDK